MLHAFTPEKPPKYTCKAKQKTSHKNRTDEKKIIRKYTPYNIFVENFVYKKPFDERALHPFYIIYDWMRTK